MSDETQSNALGLEFAQSSAHEEDSPSSAAPASPATVAADTGRRREKEKPYVNPDRHKTGGEREKLSGDALDQKVARIREENKKRKERNLQIQKDEEAYQKALEEDLARQQHNREIQAEVDAVRKTNARLKMDKVGNREWDSQKRNEDDRGSGWQGGSGRRGGRGSRDTRRPKRGAGGHPGGFNDRARHVPSAEVEQETTNNDWGDTPIGRDVSQWLPNSGTADASTTDSVAVSPTLNWAGPPIGDISKWLPDSSDVAGTAGAGGNLEDWGPPPTSGSSKGGVTSPSNINDWANEPLFEGQGAGAGEANAEGEEGEAEEEQTFEVPGVAADIIGGDDGSGFSADPNEPKRDWAGSIIPSSQDWGPVPSAEELERSLDPVVAEVVPEAEGDAGAGAGGRGRGRGRGRSDGERGGRRGEGRGGRGNGERGRGRGDFRGRGRGDGNRGRGDGGRGWGGRGSRGGRDRSETTGGGEAS